MVSIIYAPLEVAIPLLYGNSNYPRELMSGVIAVIIFFLVKKDYKLHHNNCIVSSLMKQAGCHVSAQLYKRLA